MQSNESNESASICKICHKHGHTVYACWHKYDDSHLLSVKHFGRNKMMGPKAAYMTNFEPFTSYAPSIEEPYVVPHLNYKCMYYLPYSLEEFIALKTYIANYERLANKGWYLDNGATHHLTNNIANMHVREEFIGLGQLVISNGLGLPITHIVDAYFGYKGSN